MQSSVIASYIIIRDVDVGIRKSVKTDLVRKRKVNGLTMDSMSDFDKPAMEQTCNRN